MGADCWAGLAKTRRKPSAHLAAHQKDPVPSTLHTLNCWLPLPAGSLFSSASRSQQLLPAAAVAGRAAVRGLSSVAAPEAMVEVDIGGEGGYFDHDEVRGRRWQCLAVKVLARTAAVCQLNPAGSALKAALLAAHTRRACRLLGHAAPCMPLATPAGCTAVDELIDHLH